MNDESTAPQRQPETRAEVDPDVAQLLGLRPADSGSMPDASEIDTVGEMTDTRIYQGDLEARPPDSDQPGEQDWQNLESLNMTQPRDGETDDPNEAAEEGLTWIPPIDPPLRVGDDGPEVAAGFGTTAQDEPFDADHHGEALPALGEIEARVLEALRADAATAGLADRIELEAEGEVIRLTGTVDDLEDEDSILGVVESVTGVRSIDNRITVAAVEDIAVERT